MSKLASENSISGRVDRSTRFLTIVLAIPAVISLVMMLLYASWYQASLLRMETVADLKPMVSTHIPEAVWETVAGRENFDESSVYKEIEQVNKTLDDIVEKDWQSDRLELIIARRTMETLTQYVQQIETMLAERAPIVESEHTLEEVRDVAALVESMLDDYISNEIALVAEANKEITLLVAISAAVEGVLLIAALIFSAHTRKRMERFVQQPIKQLEHVAGVIAAGNLQSRVPPTNVSELESLTEGINIMADRLESLIDQNRREQDNLRKAELRTLQAQINPHFLYNTLDTIIWQAEAGHSDRVISLTRSMSDFFRISLSSGEDWIPVSQELKHLAGYLSIQQMRYRDILTWEIDVEEKLGEYYVLKLLLQPLVENALYHGIKFKRGGGHIKVSGKQDGNYMVFAVADTGKGMSPEQLEEVRTCMREGRPTKSPVYVSGSSGFGMSNVDQRIRLYYNQPHGLQIESGEGGTTVSLRVPVKRREEVLGD